MKRLLSIALALVFALALGCTPAEEKPGGTVVEGSASEWTVTVGGKQYQVLADDETAELYTDSKAEDTEAGVTFSGSGGYWDKADGTSGAGAGGVYTVPVDAREGFSVEFTIDVIGRYDTVHVNNGNWDSWFAFGIVNRPKMFTTKSATEDPAEGLVGLYIPFATPSDGHNGSVIMYDCGQNFSYKGDNSQDGAVQAKHTLELKKSEDEWGVEYALYLDGVKLSNGGTIMEARFNDLFPDGKVYFEFYMQNWNARPKLGDSEEDKTYPASRFTVHSISNGSATIRFGTK